MIERIDRSRSPECATSPHALRIPDRSGHPAIRYSSNRLQVRLGCVRLSPSCPFRLLHTALLPGQRGITPAFGYGAPHPSAEGTSTPLTHALPSAHYDPVRLPPGPPSQRTLSRSALSPRRISPFARPACRSRYPADRSRCVRRLLPETVLPSPSLGRVGVH